MGQVLPLALGAIGGMAGASFLGPALASGLSSVLPALGGEAGAAALGATTGLSVGDAAAATGLTGLSSAQLGKYAGGALGSLGGSMLGSQLTKGMTSDEAGQALSPAGLKSFPNAQGIETPKFQFQTVGVQPSATIGARGNDLTELLKKFSR